MIAAPLGRLGYRVAYAGLVVWSRVLRPHTRGVKCVVCRGDELLLVRHSYGPRAWDLPGGFVRRDETFESTARRELAEELGVTAPDALRDLGQLEQRVHGRYDTVRAIRVDIGDRAAAARSLELRATGWFRRDALPADRYDIVDRILALDGGLPASGQG